MPVRPQTCVAILRRRPVVDPDRVPTLYLYAHAVPADAVRRLPARCARLQVPRLFRALARAFRFFSRPRHSRQHLDPRRLARRGQRGSAADRGADAPLPRFAVRDHDSHADWFRSRAAIVRRPRVPVIMETEILPNLFMTCPERGISIVIANARLSEKSLRGYWPIQPLVRRAIRCASFVAAQSTSDGERLRALGA